jgi:putative transposase
VYVNRSPFLDHGMPTVTDGLEPEEPVCWACLGRGRQDDQASTSAGYGPDPCSGDHLLKDAGVEVVLSGIRMPRMNAIMERWVQTCRRELLDRTLIWNQRHLLHALHEYERFYNEHRPHQGIVNARPLHPLPAPIADPEQIARLNIRRRDHLGGILHEYEHAA